jgi:hypothetical protein
MIGLNDTEVNAVSIDSDSYILTRTANIGAWKPY